MNGYVFAIGGFDNKDADGIAPNTLDSCERFSIYENKWYTCCSMNEARAFSAACTMQDQFIYLFGGFHDYDVLQSIEKFDSVLDNWLTLYVKLPIPLAKLGVAPIDSSKQIAVVGGMSGTFHRQRTAFILDLKGLKFNNIAEMKVAKTFNGNVHAHDGYIYAFGGNEKDACERYDHYSNRWEMVQSYGDITKASELNGWVQIYCPFGMQM